ncbi:MAG: 16S rRNA (adenine(1518)-N(6)/adenine(1519)-N(6))-dimethyltransferase [Halothiobacillus sp. 24-54-40]|jgi:16S rRNA (adenine1518-N6/adenine1519-N6)-dimethyltransferase|nr:MAG: 16S rRNA (adenine(1518)-N(6)/adenine(1519)-N(6))-dimethyltransferase [Halothiobacillus sp. 35-54-62]OYY54843.1 MAG: 16S rRNA (adenine(1518)-N(6)/adenine(1519)-N(6))-dimethyltransferase [Halothiobacillus sp. 28-55-5]OYZ86549.1 MAG: 16S rRNA (adenine(1518)-N(6)/adenine(1519)-N(6))-dimethyltransferase [Halothiobacillus sp. 24-54-40]OZA80863.1 MAG: 16S rRNA (adenine(1518)-N(6)/adenine(1519)-N(6))-dimethyltransferase [Halothiobacillus sp. 39-53-45]HQS03373.1 16S rRNA (adenine(1518)-N(6)/aden
MSQAIAPTSPPASTRYGVQDGHRARKRFGQNFLTDEAVIARIVAAIHPRATDRMIEIGPGLGALTCQLIQPLDALTVVELDRDIIPKLQARCAGQKTAHTPEGAHKLTILSQDALSLDLTPLAAHGALRIAGNLPYNIATPLIFHLLDQAKNISDMTFMLQKEVALRLAASPGSRDYGRLSIMVQTIAQVELLFIVPPEAFNPPPKVDSAIVQLTPRAQPRVSPELRPLFAELVGLAFAHRRKTLQNNLKHRLPASTILAAGLEPSIRAEQISIDAFIHLAQTTQRLHPPTP